jgi:peptidoglycan LD-endopeptidase CwlK
MVGPGNDGGVAVYPYGHVRTPQPERGFSMPPTLDDLIPSFRDGVSRLLDACAARGVEMRMNETLRTPFDQARFWRQSRTLAEIQAKIAELQSAGAPFLADCIRRVGPQHGDPVTNAPPGLSWHQWGEALDCFWVVDGEAEWSTTKKVNGVNGFRVYANEAHELGLDAGGLWTKLKDWPHVQLRPGRSPLALMSLQAIDTAMAARFGP